MPPFLHDVGVLTSLVTCKMQRGSVGMFAWLSKLLQH